MSTSLQISSRHQEVVKIGGEYVLHDVTRHNQMHNGVTQTEWKSFRFFAIRLVRHWLPNENRYAEPVEEMVLHEARLPFKLASEQILCDVSPLDDRDREVHRAGGFFLSRDELTVILVQQFADKISYIEVFGDNVTNTIVIGDITKKN